MNAIYRPTPVTVISWLLLVSAGSTVLFIPIVLVTPSLSASYRMFGISAGTAMFIAILGAIANSVAATGMLKRLAWGRQLYLISAPLLTLLTIVEFHFQFIQIFVIGLLWYAGCAYFLTRKPANDYFNCTSDPATRIGEDVPAPPAVRIPTGRRIGSIILLVISGYALSVWLMLAGILFRQTLALLVASIIIAAPASLLLYAGIRLWNRQQWLLLLGIVLTCSGALLCVVAYMMSTVMSNPAFMEQMHKVDPDMMERIVGSSLFTGALALIVGAGSILIYRRTVRGDNPSAPGTPLSPPFNE